MLDIADLIPWEKKVSGTVLRGHYSPPSGKPVIHFLHGNGFTGLVYWPFLKSLTDDFDLFISCVQAQGDSESTEKFWGWNRHAGYSAEVWADYQHLWQGVPQIAMGHSFGGVVSSLMLANSDLVKQYGLVFEKLILLDPVFFLPHMIGAMTLSDFFGFGSISSLSKITLKRTRQWVDRESAFANLCGKGMFKVWHPESMEAYVNYALKDVEEGVALKCEPEMEAAVFASFPRKLWTNLKKLSLPVTMLYGEDTYPFVLSAAVKLAKKNKNVVTLKVHGGHCFMLEHPKQSADLLMPFLK